MAERIPPEQLVSLQELSISNAFEIAAEPCNVSIDPTRLQTWLEQVAREAGEDLRPLRAEERRLREELGRLATKRHRLVELFEDTLIGKEEFTGRRAELERTGAELETQLREVTASLQKTAVGTVDLDANVQALRDLAAVYRELDLAERRALLGTVVSRIVVGERDIQYGLYLIPDCMDARAVQISKQTEETPPLIELTLTTPRYPCQTFADRLRQYRRERGWRQVDLAKAIGVHEDTVRNWETGRCKPRLETLGLKAVTIIRKVLPDATPVSILP